VVLRFSRVRSIRAVSALHRVIGFAVVATFALGWIWGLGAKVARRGPGDGYWTWLAVAQVVASAQALLGTILLLLGRRLEAEGVLGGTLHYVYGYLPLLLFVFAHVVARAGDARAIGIDRPLRPWVPFAWASFISFGLTLRALMTGLGL
jgi:Na+/alanine symporter